MKRLASVTAAVLLALTGLTTQASSPFDAGSDGSYGPIQITTNTTLDLPPDGIFRCTTITIAAGATLRFNPNPLNTPVYLLAQNEVAVAGTIDVSGTGYNGWQPGQGGPGGFCGGYGGLGIDLNYLGGDGQGPGAGRNLNTPQGYHYAGVHATNVNANNRVYGNSLLVPLLGGSGGCGSNGADGNNGQGGGGGGGALLIAANTKVTLSGAVLANGGMGALGGGSGGAIRIVSPCITGSGALWAAGGMATVSLGGSLGRIRLDCVDAYAYRSLTMYGVATRGTQLFVFPTFSPRLDIVEVAGHPIPEGTNALVQIELPLGSPTNQTVTVQARGFTNDIPITVAVTPENRPSTHYDAVLSTTQDPSRLILDVFIPDGTVSRVHAWTR